MRLTVVGSGSSGNAYVLEDRYHKLILDAGVKWKDIEAACGFDVSNIEGCLCSHNHLDHCKHVDKADRSGIDCYTGHKAVEPIYEATGTILRPLLERRWNSIGKWLVMPLEVNHDVPCYGFIIISPRGESLAYFTDFSYIGVNGKEITLKKQNINHWLIAVNYTGEPEETEEKEQLKGHIYGGHSSLEYVKRYLTRSVTDSCKTIIACHLSSRNSDAEQIQKELKDLVPQCQVGIARKGETFDL